jgi:DNA primase catalytic core
VKIPEEKIQEIREVTDIVEIVSQYVTLKKQGKSYIGLCPFHTEKTPSFSVNPARGFYHCFGCGAGGNVFTFTMQMERTSFPEAIRTLADKAGIRKRKRSRHFITSTNLLRTFFRNAFSNPKTAGRCSNTWTKEVWGKKSRNAFNSDTPPRRGTDCSTAPRNLL